MCPRPTRHTCTMPSIHPSTPWLNNFGVGVGYIFTPEKFPRLNQSTGNALIKFNPNPPKLLFIIYHSLNELNIIWTPNTPINRPNTSCDKSLIRPDIWCLCVFACAWWILHQNADGMEYRWPFCVNALLMRNDYTFQSSMQRFAPISASLYLIRLFSSVYGVIAAQLRKCHYNFLQSMC